MVLATPKTIKRLWLSACAQFQVGRMALALKFIQKRTARARVRLSSS